MDALVAKAAYPKTIDYPLVAEADREHCDQARLFLIR